MAEETDNPSLHSEISSFLSSPPSGDAPPTPSEEELTFQNEQHAADLVPDATVEAEQVAEAVPAAPAAGGSEAEPVAGEAVQDALADDDDIPPIDTTGQKAIQIDTPRFNRIYAGYKLARDIREFAPSVEDAKAHFETATDYRAMHDDFEDATPARIDRFLDHWQSQSQDGFLTLAARLPQRLQALNPAAYEKLQQDVLQERIEQAYQEAAESGDPKAIHRAQTFDFYMTGKYRDKGDIKKPDPLAAREAELKKREDAQKSEDARRQQATWANIEGRIGQAKSQGLAAAIDKALDPVKSGFEKAPKLFQALKTEIVRGVTEKLGADAEWMRNHEIDGSAIRRKFDQAWRTQARTDLNADVKALVGGYVARASNAIVAVARPLVAEATATMLRESQAKHAQLQKSESRRGPAGGGAPAKNGSPVAVPPEASLGEAMRAFFHPPR